MLLQGLVLTSERDWIVEEHLICMFDDEIQFETKGKYRISSDRSTSIFKLLIIFKFARTHIIIILIIILIIWLETGQYKNREEE